MKKLFLIVFVCSLFFSIGAMAAVDDGITLSGECTKISGSNVRQCTVAWANDTGTDIGPTAINLPVGYILSMDVIPDGTNAPTANYDVYVYKTSSEATSNDIFGGTCIDHSATLDTSDCVPYSSTSGVFRQAWQDGTVFVHVDGLTNSNDDEGTLIIYVEVE